MAYAVNVENILEGPAHIYVGASVYDTTPDTMPADTVAFGGVNTGTWRSLGYTSEAGLQEHFATDRGTVMTAQQRHPAMRPLNSHTDRVTGTLLEVTLENLQTIMGRGTISTVAVSGATPGHKELRLTDAIEDYVAILVEGLAPPLSGGAPRRILFPAVLASGTAEPIQRQGDAGANAGVGFEFQRVGGTESEVLIRDVLLP
jgi:hypothetical protein